MVESRLGIIGAMPQEIAKLDANVQDQKYIQDGITKLTFGYLAETPVVYASAGDVGQVNASSLATKLISSYDVGAIVFTGVAGGLKPEQKVGDILVSDKLVNYDIDVRDFRAPWEPNYQYSLGENFPSKKRFIQADRDLVDLALEAPLSDITEYQTSSGETVSIPGNRSLGVIASGSKFLLPTDKRSLYDSLSSQGIEADAVEMEGAGVAKVCSDYGAPFVVLRALSDGLSGDGLSDFNAFVGKAAEGLYSIVEHIAEEYTIPSDVQDRLALARASI